PVLTIERAADAVPLARALVAGGLPVIEVTLRTLAALDAIAAIAGEVPDCIVGVGTVTRTGDIAAAVAAGPPRPVPPAAPARPRRRAWRRGGPGLRCRCVPLAGRSRGRWRCGRAAPRC